MAENQHSHHKDQEASHDEAPHEEGEGNWLISYADMMTLLMSFFALMYALAPQNQASSSSSSNQNKKMEEAQESLAKTFDGKVQKPFDQLYEDLEKAIKEAKLEKQVKMEQSLSSLSITFVGSALFPDGSSEISEEIEGSIEKLVTIVASEIKDNWINLEGHTDDRPIKSEKFPSNWELSSQRASTLARLFESKGVARKNITVVGFADSKPVEPNLLPNGQPNPEAQAKNRRVVIQLLKKTL